MLIEQALFWQRLFTECETTCLPGGDRILSAPNQPGVQLKIKAYRAVRKTFYE